ncbi:hypothetical protein EBO15_02535 [Actinomadura harenae]|uniref:DUF8083 domain-containing protein n=1 Tax=Actinomadura harenae TaxID=2483351 RepID=A0A3M2MCR9_9ACTN|nr:hypothetical protein EBO15_02535 [Actinomadura harenae]
MFPYAAYLRVYEPVTAYPEPARTLWTAYAESRRRPRRVHALEVEHRRAARRLAGYPPEVAPRLECQDAYVRRTDDMIYICPWETRLRSWLAFERFREETSSAVASAFVPPDETERAERAFAHWRDGDRPLRPHILTATWHVPLAWFVPFDRAERCLLLGRTPGRGHLEEPGLASRGTGGGAAASAGPAVGTEPDAAPGGDAPDERGEHARRGPTTASATRTLIYVTTMAEARRRIAAALPVLRDDLAADPREPVAPTTGRLAALGSHLDAFHPRSLVELDYGGLVHLLDDAALRADDSVAETGVALAAMARGEVELTVAMYQRLLARWRPVRARRTAN